ncbi:hypothetical protein EDC65_1762 [Stella humosa]|uniref:Uncharacterized protein n=1 Tax=Stella humosa TaxID=94 RepID=A0A3N1M8E3_9PROT|nr:hypothetical protein [Stella humosa]ROP99967.1 hypothetical protein EDC65_1762 [Stella humosa]
MADGRHTTEAKAAKESAKARAAQEAREAEARARLLARLPQLPDDDLQTLSMNAERLEQNGTAGQKAQAAAMLPAIRAALAERAAAKPPVKPRAARKPAAAAVAAG